MSAPHGTNNRYSVGCRCDPCREAHTAYQRAYRAAHRIPGRVDVGPAQDHMRVLLSTGMTRVEIGVAAGVGVETVRNVLHSAPGARCNRSTAEAILAIPVDLSRVPAAPAPAAPQVPEPPDAQTLRDRASMDAYIRRRRARLGVPA